MIILVVFLSTTQVHAQYQTLNAAYWCINSMQQLTDTNGVQYTEVSLYNNDVALDSGLDWIGIEALFSGSDTIKPFGLNEHLLIRNYGITDSLITYRIDTTIAMSAITGILLRRSRYGCGTMILESIFVNNNCESDSPLGSLPVKKNTITLFPNPTDGLLFIKGDQVEKVQLKVISVDGRIMMNESMMINSFINLSLLSKGIYYLHINDQFAQKIILK